MRRHAAAANIVRVARIVVSDHLKAGPFTLEEARAAGLTKWHLEFGPWRRIAPRTYVWSKLRLDPTVLLSAAVLRLPESAVFSGLTAAWLHGLDVEPCRPIEVTVPEGHGVSGKVSMRVSRALLSVGDVEPTRGFSATTLPRTLRDLARRLTLTEAVVLVDSALNQRLVELETLTAWLDSRQDDRAVGRLRRALAHAEPAAESPMESRLRMLLVLAGLPRPMAQIPLYDGSGRFLGRPDLYYPDHRLGVEYDGETHKETLAEDSRRHNRLLAGGVRLLHFTAGDVYGAPTRVVNEVRSLLANRAA
ncbi:MAG TPA: DUF559 domain-containing protein [Candidatus Dormibacteraeota bacterium]